jgi:hypothetical protein
MRLLVNRKGDPTYFKVELSQETYPQKDVTWAIEEILQHIDGWTVQSGGSFIKYNIIHDDINSKTIIEFNKRGGPEL